MNEVTNTYGHTHSMLEHVFLGEVDVDGYPKGFHCNRNRGDENAEIDEGSIAIISGNIFEAKVKSKINGRFKRSNDGYSTFFPCNFTRQQILDGLNNAIQYEDNYYTIQLGHETISIIVHSDRDNNIVTFYPKNPDEV